jgi:hypothetical protein
MVACGLSHRRDGLRRQASLGDIVLREKTPPAKTETRVGTDESSIAIYCGPTQLVYPYYSFQVELGQRSRA